MALSSLHRFFFYFVPPLLLAMFFAVELLLAETPKKEFYSEFGIELFQEAVLFLCLGLSAGLLMKLRSGESPWLRAWLAVSTLACFYIAFEEISWGQKFLEWHTPEHWSEGMTQKETNIHNKAQIFNRVPRTILEIGILVAGIVIPALMRWAPAKLPQKFSAIYPLRAVWVCGVLTLIAKLLEQFRGWFGVEVFYRRSEVMEVFMYWFIFLYLISLLLKWRAEGRLR